MCIYHAHAYAKCTEILFVCARVCHSLKVLPFDDFHFTQFTPRATFYVNFPVLFLIFLFSMREGIINAFFFFLRNTTLDSVPTNILFGNVDVKQVIYDMSTFLCVIFSWMCLVCIIYIYIAVCLYVSSFVIFIVLAFFVLASDWFPILFCDTY